MKNYYFYSVTGSGAFLLLTCISPYLPNLWKYPMACLIHTRCMDKTTAADEIQECNFKTTNRAR